MKKLLLGGLGFVASVYIYFVIDGDSTEQHIAQPRASVSRAVVSADKGTPPATLSQAAVASAAEAVQQGSDTDNGKNFHKYLYLGENRQFRLELEKMILTKVWEDGTTQYDYDRGKMVVTILPDGETLLLPEEI
jgi:hypothetical protein